MTLLDMNEFARCMQATIQAEEEIIEDKLQQGINGLEWLVMQLKIDKRRKESFERFTRRFAINAQSEIIKDTVQLDHDTFSKKYGLNWWTVFDEILTYLAILKEENYDLYFNVLQSIYEKETD